MLNCVDVFSSCKGNHYDYVATNGQAYDLFQV